MASWEHGTTNGTTRTKTTPNMLLKYFIVSLIFICCSCETIRTSPENRDIIENIRERLERDNVFRPRTLIVKTIIGERKFRVFYCIFRYSQTKMVVYTSKYETKILQFSEDPLKLAKQLTEYAYDAEFL